MELLQEVDEKEAGNTVGDTLMGKNLILVFKKLDNISYILYTIVKERKKLRAKMVGLIDVLQESGNRLREPYTKSLGNGIFELRAKHGNDLARSLFFFYHEGRIIITNGFVKKTKKTPRSEIDTAKKYREDFYCQEGAK